MVVTQSILDIPLEHQKNVFGQLDLFVRKIEKALSVEIVLRDGEIRVKGEEENVKRAKQVYLDLTELSRRGNVITEQNVDYAIALSMENRSSEIVEIDKDVICHTVSGRPVKPKTVGQKTYVDAMRKNMIVFGVGPAGTGKTYLAIAMAVQAFKNQEVDKIILTRPAIEAGEKLGFLPGDLQSKIDPYLRPLYDALYQIMGAESFTNHFEKGEIEVAPLAYMRGRTLDNAFIILDEAQNTTPSQMKMFLTRIGFNSKCIVTGDKTQKDLPAGTQSGLDAALRILKKIDEIGIVELDKRDVVRHPLVQKIVEAYEKEEERQKNRRSSQHEHTYRG
ncbi:MAG: PhoH family protein [Lachnospiraceae bacterium]|nr:PhoH family protein [Lachnospiraceae bacterium]